MENKETSREEIITKETLPSVLEQIAWEREKKGSSETLIPRIRKIRQQAENMGETSTVVQLYQEEFLLASHMVIEERSKRFKANPVRAARGLLLMQATSRSMEKYLTNESLDPVIKTRIFRFLGRFKDQKGQYKESENHYREGLAYFDLLSEPEKRFNRLEFAGFLSFSLLKQGKNFEGVSLSLSTLKEFDESEEGKWLKENSYYTWAVWKSGIEIRNAEILLKRKGPPIMLAKTLLKDAQKILQMPDGTSEIFRLRLDELNEIKKQLKDT